MLIFFRTNPMITLSSLENKTENGSINSIDSNSTEVKKSSFLFNYSKSVLSIHFYFYYSSI